jgi:hypothetical protein
LNKQLNFPNWEFEKFGEYYNNKTYRKSFYQVKLVMMLLFNNKISSAGLKLFSVLLVLQEYRSDDVVDFHAGAPLF